MTNEKIRFGSFELDPRAGELRRGTRRVRLQEKPLKVLEALLAKPGEIVTREELRARLWPANIFVDFDNGLNNAVNKLRAVLADSAAAPKYIETVGRRGYRFVGALDTVAVTAPTSVSSPDGSASPVRSQAAADPVAARPTRDSVGGRTFAPRRRWVAVTVAVAAVIVAVVAGRFDSGDGVPRIESLAVLPLENLSSDVEQEYFSDGMTDALISHLAGIRSLRVISRQSAMQYKGSALRMPDIARELGVSGIIEGTVQRSSDRVRISVQLIHAPTDRHLWAAEYSRPLDDVIELQSEIARTVAREIAATVTPEETARLVRAERIAPEAYDLYLRGRFFWTRRTEEALHRAVDYFERAIAIQPDFARAHAAIAEAYGPLGGIGWVHPAEAAGKMRAAAERALEIDPNLVEGLTALGACAAFHEWNWAEGERLFLRALEINPNYVVTHMWYGLWLERQGRQAENLRERERAFQLDPLDGAAVAGLGNALFLNGRVDDAVSVLEKTLEIDPGNPQLHANLAKIHAYLGRYDEAAAGYERAGDLGGLGYVYGIAGRKDEANAALEALERRAQQRYVPPYSFALIHVGLGNRGAALDALENGFQLRDPTMADITVAPELKPLRAEPRFIALLERMGVH